jgi:ABC-type glycerol-3-phosphate transport system permease component
MIRRSKSIIGKISIQAILIITAFVSVGPLLFIWNSSLKTNTELLTSPLSFPHHLQFNNFAEAWQRAHLGTFIVNSFKVTIPTLLIVLICGGLAGYAFAMMRFKGSTFLFALIILGLTVPVISTAVPIYFTVFDLGLQDTHIGLIMVESSVAFPLAVFLTRAAFKDLPSELRDAVLVDGGNEFDVFAKVMVPLARPTFTALTVLVFLQVWNSFLLPLVLLTSENLYTMPLGLSFLQGRFSSNVVLILAATTLISLPTIIIYVIFQRQFIEGVIEGSIK